MTDNALNQVAPAIAGDTLLVADLIMSGCDDEKRTLRESALSQVVQVGIKSLDSNVVIEYLFENYIQYLEDDRLSRKGDQPPIDSLREWTIKHGLPPDNTTLARIAKTIWMDGHKGLPILAQLEENIDKNYNTRYTENLSDTVIKKVVAI